MSHLKSKKLASQRMVRRFGIDVPRILFTFHSQPFGQCDFYQCWRMERTGVWAKDNYFVWDGLSLNRAEFWSLMKLQPPWMLRLTHSFNKQSEGNFLRALLSALPTAYPLSWIVTESSFSKKVHLHLSLASALILEWNQILLYLSSQHKSFGNLLNSLQTFRKKLASFPF